MSIEYIFDKLADAAQLTPQERLALTMHSRRTSTTNALVDGWSPDGKSNPKFDEIEADNGRFSVMPNAAMVARLKTSQTISNNTYTPILFEDSSGSTDMFQLDPNDYTKINVGYTGRWIFVGGKVEWSNNGSGRRGIHVNLYNSSDTLLYGNTMHSMKPTGVDLDTLPFFVGFRIADYAKTSYMKITVYQNSGSTMTVGFVNCAFGLLI